LQFIFKIYFSCHKNKRAETEKVFNVSFLEVRETLHRKIMESLILGKIFLTMGGGCRRISVVSTTDL
jgi:hypothetical protein